jgi:serine/threonine protein kinase
MTHYAENGILPGQKTTWNLLKKLGEGDAGEVYLVESLVDKRPAILKRPKHSVFAGEVRRQSEQIQTEGRILKTLDLILKSHPENKISIPVLLDQSKPGGEASDRFFIVIERAMGFDLSFLARISRLGLPDNLEIDASDVELAFFEEIAAAGSLPERVVLESLSAIFNLFAIIHNIPQDQPDVKALNILWNDVKPDHIFWDPHNSSFTIIDWGNGQMIEAGYMDGNLRHTTLEDRRQFIEEMKRFMSEASPRLQEALKWPEKIGSGDNFNQTYMALRERVYLAQLEQNKILAGLKEEETTLIKTIPAGEQTLPSLTGLHHQIMLFGEIPDFKGALQMAADSVGILAAEGDMEQVQTICNWAAGLPGSSFQYWQLLANLAQITIQQPEEMKKGMVDAVKAASANDWKNVLWNMMEALQAKAEPDWWFEMVQKVRKQITGEEEKTNLPLLTLRRLTLQLQSDCHQLEDNLERSPSGEEEQGLAAMRSLYDLMRQAIQNWVQLDPYPPFSGINYGEIEQLFNEIEKYLGGRGAEMVHLLKQPRAQVNIVLETWGKKEFIAASRELRNLLVLDPDRRRLVRANQAVQAAANWLQRVQNGPSIGEHLSEFVTGLEYEGRELRNAVGPAAWLDVILEGFKAMRQGAWPGDLVISQPALIAEVPWLQRFTRNEVLALTLHPELTKNLSNSIAGVKEGHFGHDKEIGFVEPLDAWAPEARGSSARVYLGLYQTKTNAQQEAAIKIMRRDKADYALPLFREEIQVLNVMDDVPGVARLLESGFIHFNGEDGVLPADTDLEAIQSMRGDVIRMGPDSSQRFLELLETQVQDGWTPYLMIEKRRREDSLLLMCDASINHGRFQAVSDLLFMSIQICDILQLAHKRNVVYRDHKILHYYWQPENNGVSLIDWNVARYHPEGITEFDIQMDLVQFGARGLHHILTGRTAPGALPMGPTRPEEIEQSARSYAAQWTYDDQRLSDEVRVILEQLLCGSYKSALELKEDLKRAYMDLGLK